MTELTTKEIEKLAAAMERVQQLLTEEEWEEFREGVHRIALRYRDLPSKENARELRWAEYVEFFKGLIRRALARSGAGEDASFWPLEEDVRLS